jgi:hypothetical protein
MSQNRIAKWIDEHPEEWREIRRKVDEERAASDEAYIREFGALPTRGHCEINCQGFHMSDDEKTCGYWGIPLDPPRPTKKGRTR